MAKINIEIMKKQMGMAEVTPRMISDVERDILNLERIQRIAENHLKEVKLDPFYEDILFKNDKQAYEEHVLNLEKGIEEGKKYIENLKSKMGAE